MPATDPLRQMMDRLEREPIAAFSLREVQCWPSGLLSALVELRVLHEIRWTPSQQDLAEHVGPTVSPRRQRVRAARFGEPIPASQRDAPGEEGVCRQWQCSFEPLVRWLGAQLGLMAAPEAILGTWIYRLGYCRTPRGLLDVWIARGLSRAWAYDLVMNELNHPDGTLRRAHHQDRADRVIVVPIHAPVPALWPILRARTRPLADDLRWDESQHHLDAAGLVHLLHGDCATGQMKGVGHAGNRDARIGASASRSR